MEEEGDMKYLKMLFIFLTLLISSASHAFCFPKFYCLLPGMSIGVLGGINGGYDLRCKHVKTNRGYYAGMKIGQDLFYHLRVEGEVDWQWNEVNSIKNEPIQFDHARGDINIWSVMSNGIFDIPFNCQLPARPYIGGGVGYAYSSGHWVGSFNKTITPVANPITNNPVTNNAPTVNATTANVNNADGTVVTKRKHIRSRLHQGGFAWQIIAGLNFSVCYVNIGLEYRYFKTEGFISNHKFGLALTNLF